MPKRGFKSVVIHEELYWKLIERSIKEDVSPHELLWRLLMGETASRSKICIDRLSDVGLDVIFTENNKRRNALKVELDGTDHIYFKCKECNTPLLLVGVDYSDSVVEFHYLCPVCLRRIYTKYPQPFSPTVVWGILSSDEWSAFLNKTPKISSLRSGDKVEILREIRNCKRGLADSLAEIIVKSAIVSLWTTDLIYFSDGSFEVPLRVNDTFRKVFVDFVEEITTEWVPFNFKFIPYYSEYIGNIFKYKNNLLTVPKDIFIKILSDLLLREVLADLKPLHIGRYVVFDFSLKHVPRELLLPITTKRSPQRHLILEPFLNLYREFKYCLCIEDDYKKVEKVLEIAQFKRVDKKEFLQVFDRKQFDKSKKQVLAYLELVDEGIIFLEHVNSEVYILIDGKLYEDVLERKEEPLAL